RAPVLVTALPHGGAQLRHDVRPTGTPGGADGPVGPRGDAAPDRGAPRDPQPHGADPVPAPPRPARRDPHGVRPLVAAVHDPQRGAVPAGDQAPDAGVVGPVIVEYYAASEGGGTTIFAEEWLRHPGSVGRPWPGSVVRILDDDGNDVPTGDPG